MFENAVKFLTNGSDFAWPDYDMRETLICQRLAAGNLSTVTFPNGTNLRVQYHPEAASDNNFSCHKPLVTWEIFSPDRKGNSEEFTLMLKGTLESHVGGTHIFTVQNGDHAQMAAWARVLGPISLVSYLRPSTPGWDAMSLTSKGARIFRQAPFGQSLLVCEYRRLSDTKAQLIMPEGRTYMMLLNSIVAVAASESFHMI
ncbi:hypothetical protein BSR29_07130 [Boudabousia liubingyangii]|uniref:Uncharacterized protein n=1 Tax=Boudabousia liubingyangii TaxID=1921764 RepID=A0A1Q5PK46_9ACTO|nr:hypothetical protein [Boudabousia liubingyangii]OKL46588.1 hypothetical protein BSR29_07130 [Boudabousia liubingyangii]